MEAETKIQATLKRRSKKAEEIWQERYGKKKEPEPSKPVVTPGGSVTVSTSTVTEGEPPAEPPETQPETPPAEPEPVKVEPPPIPPPPPTPEVDYKAMYEKALEEAKSVKSLLETEKQRFQTLQGKYNAEVPRMSYQINTLMEEMEKLKKQPEQKPAENQQIFDPEAVKSLKADFPELYTGIVALNKQLLNEAVESLVKPISDKVKKFEEEKTVSAVSSYEQGLDDSVPNWRQLNTNAEFTTWLLEREPNGRTKHEMILDAFQRRDVKGTAYYFKEFLKTKEPPQPETPHPPVEPKKSAPVSVPRGGSTPPANPVGDTFTRQDYVRHTDEKIKGMWKGREEEWKKKEQKILKYLTRK